MICRSLIHGAAVVCLMLALAGGPRTLHAAPTPLSALEDFNIAALHGVWYEIAAMGDVAAGACADAVANFMPTSTPGALTAQFARFCQDAGPALIDGVLTAEDENHSSRMNFSYRIASSDVRHQQLNVVGLGRHNDWLVMGDDARAHLYIYSRVPLLDQSTLEQVVQRATDTWGFTDLPRLMRCPAHTDAPAEALSGCRALCQSASITRSR